MVLATFQRILATLREKKKLNNFQKKKKKKKKSRKTRMTVQKGFLEVINLDSGENQIWKISDRTTKCFWPLWKSFYYTWVYSPTPLVPSSNFFYFQSSTESVLPKHIFRNPNSTGANTVLVTQKLQAHHFIVVLHFDGILSEYFMVSTKSAPLTLFLQKRFGLHLKKQWIPFVNQERLETQTENSIAWRKQKRLLTWDQIEDWIQTQFRTVLPRVSFFEIFLRPRHILEQALTNRIDQTQRSQSEQLTTQKLITLQQAQWWSEVGLLFGTACLLLFLLLKKLV